MATNEELHDRRMEGLRNALGSLVLSALEDPDVVEVMLNDDGSLWSEKLGTMTRIGDMSADDGMTILSMVSTALKGELTKENPFVEGELPLDGSRFEGVAPPVTERPIFAIRKKATRIFTVDDYVRSGVLSFQQAEALRKAIRNLQNILVIGGTGSGKTTFCNALLHELSVLCPDVRMLILEDTRELQCALVNRVFLRASEWTTLARISLAVNRLRPDRISVGEVRDGGPALALLKLWNTGHPGGFATVHANSAYGGLTRMDQLIQEVSANPQRTLIGEAVNFAVFMERTSVGRKIKEIVRVTGYDPVKQRFLVEDVT
ncbi:P-type conjugative transfer ATPase TrbB [Methylicorpusculum sp.]|uniref:P-type conjugative transfer ATPase TrbB n=1 Tax=Methylicorpusculum sp. TaxID=2713644 RepID=UPI002ABBB7E2|nr:P-type conjugative transfer ATPase TrbB [Methylicorpusculum sp.]MDZ4153606.1 P-type conjugative transfer ATPase TrbB [Methylicorpusculum sp.]